MLTVPWFFTDFNQNIVFGFPIWAIYSICMSILYAVIIAVLIGRYWSINAGKDRTEEEL